MARNALTDLGKQAERFSFLTRDHGPQFTAVFRAANIHIVTTGIQTPVMNAIQERRHRTVRTELLDRTLAWNIAHLRRVLAEYETFYNEHRPHRTLGRAAPPRPLPDNVVDLDHFRVARRGRIGGTLHEYLPEIVRSLRPIRAERETLLPRERLRHPAVTTAEPRCFRFIVR